MNLDGINTAAIPSSLRSLPQWVLWANESRGGKPTKVPYQPNGTHAKSDDPATWCDFRSALAASGKCDGIGFVFSPDDSFCGIDLDGCRNPETGQVAEWAREIIITLDSYAEVSPSRMGVKIWIVAKSPLDRGRKVAIKDAELFCDKEPAVEVYDARRYFAVTGWHLKGIPPEPQARQSQLDALCTKYFAEEKRQTGAEYYSEVSVVERARKYLDKLPPAISGQSGHNATFRAACVLVLGFCLAEADAMGLMREYSDRCTPPWSERELLHKVQSAARQGGARGYLRNARPDRWESIKVPEYRQPKEAPRIVPEPRITTLSDAAKSYLDRLRNGGSPIVELGIADLDYALGGGVEHGEYIIFAARPSHGKSAVALQCVHQWTAQNRPCAIVSEEMSAIALGKRTLQYLTPTPQEHWSDLANQIDGEIAAYAAQRAPCLILEGCGTTEGAIVAVEEAIKQHKIQCLIVDYAQLLRGKGRSRYEQMTEVSVELRRLTTQHNLILLALCQLRREVESRPLFKPTMQDIKETGQFEQDADVVVCLCWPWRIDQNEIQSRYLFFVEKNRNRPILQRSVDGSFDPSRQTISLPGVNASVQTPFD